MTKTDLSHMNLKQLRTLAKQHKLTKYSKLSKHELTGMLITSTDGEYEDASGIVSTKLVKDEKFISADGEECSGQIYEISIKQPATKEELQEHFREYRKIQQSNIHDIDFLKEMISDNEQHIKQLIEHLKEKEKHHLEANDKKKKKKISSVDEIPSK